MPKLSERGIAHIVLLLVLLAGISGGIFLLKSPENFYQLFRPKAGPGANVMFVDGNGNQITATSSASVKVQLIDPGWVSALVSGSPTAGSAKKAAGGGPVSQSWNYRKNFSSTQGQNNLYYLAYTKSKNTYSQASKNGNKWAFTGPNSDRNFVIAGTWMAPSWPSNSVVRWTAPSAGTIDINGYFRRCCIQAGDSKRKPYEIYSVRKNTQNLWEKSTTSTTNYTYNLTTTVAAGDNIEFWADANWDSGWDGSDIDFTITYQVSPTPTPTPTATPVTTVSATLAEDPNFTVNVKKVPFSASVQKTATGKVSVQGGTIPGTMITDYTFSNSTPGTKTLYAKFIASNNQEQKASPYPITISLVAPSPSPTSAPFQLSISPTSINTGGDVTINWSDFTNPTTSDYIWWVDSNGTKTGLTMYPSNGCKDTSGSTPVSSGLCTVKAPVYVGTYRAILYKNTPSSRTEVGRSNSFTVMATSSPTPTPSSTSAWPVVTSVSSYNPQPGNRVTINGSGFVPSGVDYSTLKVIVARDDATVVVLASVTPLLNNTYWNNTQIQFTVPQVPSIAGGMLRVLVGDKSYTTLERFSISSTLSNRTPSSYRRVFVTNNTYTGNLGGLLGGDIKCQQSADTVNLGGFWKAWLSDKNISASSRLNHSTVPYKLLNGTLVADNWTDLTDGQLKDYGNIQVYENGKVRLQGDGTYYVWTGTNTSGNSMSNNCVNWTTSQGFDGTYGSLANINVAWTEAWGSSSSCGMQYRLYCFEQ